MPMLTAISPGTLQQRSFDTFCRSVSEACEAGLPGVLVREPDLGDRALLELCALLRAIVGGKMWLALHDRVHLAESANVDAVHLGFRSLPPAEARAMLPDHIRVGYSAHAGDRKHDREGADYLVFGPVLDTPSKRGIQAPVGFEGLRSAVADTPLPLYAIGGLKPEHAARVRASGARGIVVMSGVFGAANPSSAVRAYLEAWSS